MNVVKYDVWTCMEHSLVQILVEVANIQMRSLKTEVEKGSIGIVIIYGLVDPKRYVKSIEKSISIDIYRKGIRLIFLNQREG